MENAVNFFSVVTAIATVALAFLNYRYVCLTQQMLQRMKSDREPFVDIAFEPQNSELHIKFTNVGGSAARNVRFEVLQDCQAIIGENNKGIAEMQPITNGISYIPAGCDLSYIAGCYPFVNEERRIAIRIKYEDDTGTKLQRTAEYDLHQFDNLLIQRSD